MPPGVGAKVPDVTVYDFEKKPRKLSEFFGKKVVLAFFPGAFTGVCTREMCRLRDSLSLLNDAKAQVVAISIDSPFANMGFAEANKLAFPILSDYSRSAIKQFDILQHDFAGLIGYVVAKRSVFVLDKSGVVKWSWVSDNPGVEPPYDEIPQALSSFD